jgi:hypothetical protein
MLFFHFPVPANKSPKYAQNLESRKPKAAIPILDIPCPNHILLFCVPHSGRYAGPQTHSKNPVLPAEQNDRKME